MPSTDELRTLDGWPLKRDIRRGRMLLLGTLAVGAALLAALIASGRPKVLYARTVSEVVRQPARETPMRVQGVLVRGSLCKVDAKCEFRFRLTDQPSNALSSARNELEVRYVRCVIPDTFRDVPGLDIEIAVEGEICEDCTHFEATVIVAKCPAKYELSDAGMPAARARPVPRC